MYHFLLRLLALKKVLTKIMHEINKYSGVHLRLHFE